MTNEENNIKIAEALQWTDCHKSLAAISDKDISERKLVGIPPGRLTHCLISNFCTDLNAMHEAEVARIVTKGLSDRFQYELRLICLRDYHTYGVTHAIPVHATARQRAEAFLRTLDLWTE